MKAVNFLFILSGTLQLRHLECNFESCGRTLLNAFLYCWDSFIRKPLKIDVVVNLCNFYKGGRQSIVISMSVWLSVCLPASISPELHVRFSPYYLCVFVACCRAQYPCRGLVLSILWMTSYLHIMGRMGHIVIDSVPKIIIK